MIQENIDKILRSIDDGFIVYEDIEKDLEDGKLSLLEGAQLVIKHGGKAMRFISSIPELGKEIIDIDSQESGEIFDAIVDHLGPGNDEIRQGVKEIIIGSGSMNQGIQRIIAEKKRLKEV